MVAPVVLAHGTPVFQDVDGQLKLRLVESRSFNNGNVLLRYEPDLNRSA